MILPADQRRVRIVEGFRAHLLAAADLPFLPDSRLRATALPQDIQLAIGVATRRQDGLAHLRRAQCAILRRHANRLRPVSRRINLALMPPSVLWIAADFNTAFVAVATAAIGWLDTTLAERFVYGFPVVGPIPDSGVYRLLPEPTAAADAAARYERFQATAAAWTRTQAARLTAARMSNPQQLKADMAVAAKTAKEKAKGLVRGPYSTIDALQRAVAEHYPGAPPGTLPRPLDRFGVPQKGDIRAIDDGRRNGANGAARMLETITSPTFAFPAIVARAVRVVSEADGLPMPPLALALADLASAYRLIPTAQPWFTAIAFFNPTRTEDGVLCGREYYYLPGHNFGLTAAVVNFNRYPEFIVVMARVFTAVPIDHYVDDFIITDVSAGGDSALFSLRTIILACGPGSARPGARLCAPVAY